MTANIIFGWCISSLILISGLIIRIIVKVKSKKGYKEDDRTWKDFKET
jgi:NSS family neurotransmitter:Na+ symporter